MISNASLTYDQISGVVVVVVSDAIFSANTEPIWEILFAIDVFRLERKKSLFEIDSIEID